MDLGTVLVTYAADVQSFLDDTQSVLDAMDKVNSANTSMGSSSGSGFFDTLSKGADLVTGSFGKVGSAIGDAAGGMLDFAKSAGEGALFIKEFGGAAISMAKAVFDDNAAMETLQVQFTHLLGSGDAATKMMGELDDAFSGTKMDVKTVDAAAAKLLQMKTASADVIPELSAIGNAVAGLGKGSDTFNMIVSKMGLMTETGKVTTSQMTALSKQGIDAWAMLAAGMGVSVTTAMADVKKGLVSGTDAVSALTKGMNGAFSGQMVAQAQTFSGALQVIANNAEKAWLSFSGPAFKEAEKALDTISAMLSSPAFQEFATEMGTLVGKAVSGLAAILSSTLGPALKDLLTAIGATVKAFVDWVTSSKTTSDLFSALGEAIKAVFTIIGGLIELLAKLIKLFSDTGMGGDVARAAILALGIALTALKLTELITTIPVIVAGFIAWATSAATAAAATAILDTVLLPLLALVAIVAVITAIILVVQHWGEISKWLGDQWKKAQDTMKGIGDTMAKNWKADMDSLQSDTNNLGKSFDKSISQPLQNMVGTINNAINNWGIGIQKSVTTLAKNFGDWFSKEFGKGIQNSWVILTIEFNKGLTAMGSAVGTILGQIGKAFQNFFKPIQDALTTFVTAVSKTFNDFLKGIDTNVTAFSSKIDKNWKTMTDSLASDTQKLSTNVSSSMDTFGKNIQSGLDKANTSLLSFDKNVEDGVTKAFDTVVGLAQTAWDAFYKAISDGLSKAMQAITSFGSGIVNAIAKPFGDAMDAIKGFLDKGIDAVNGFVSSVNKALSSLQFGFQFPTLPQFASGVENFGGGLAVVGEKGPELVNLGAGSSVYPLNGVPFASTPALPTMASGTPYGGATGTQTINLVIDGRILAQALGASMTREIRLVTAVRR